MNTHFIKSLKFFTTFVLFGMAMNTYAVDDKTIPGASCQAYFGTQEGDIGKYVNGAVNTAAASRWVSCGVVRDNVTAAVPGGMWVNVTPGTFCVGRSNDAAGGFVSAGSATGSGWITVTPAAAVLWGNYMVYCLVPAGGRVSTIAYREAVPTD